MAVLQPTLDFITFTLCVRLLHMHSRIIMSHNLVTEIKPKLTRSKMGKQLAFHRDLTSKSTDGYTWPGAGKAPLYIDHVVRHLDQYRISYHYTPHLYSLALVCNCIPSQMSVARRERAHTYIVFDLQLSDTFCTRGYMSFTPIVKKWHNQQETNSLRIKSTVKRLLYLTR